MGQIEAFDIDAVLMLNWIVEIELFFYIKILYSCQTELFETIFVLNYFYIQLCVNKKKKLYSY